MAASCTREVSIGFQAHRAYLRQCAAARPQSGENDNCCEFGGTIRAERFEKLSKLLQSGWKGPSRFFLSSKEYLMRRGDSACPDTSKLAAESAAHLSLRAPGLVFFSSADFPFIYCAFKVRCRRAPRSVNLPTRPDMLLCVDLRTLVEPWPAVA